MATVQEAIKRLRYQFVSEGADKVVADQNKVTSAIVGSTTSQERATLSLDKSFASIERRYNSQVRAQQDYEKVQRQVNAAVAANPALQERANEVLRLAKAANDNLAQSHVGLSSQAMAAQHSIRSMAEQLAMGVSPTQALTGQLNRLAFVATGPGGVKAAFSEAGAALSALVSVQVLAIGGVIALAAATAAAALSWRSFALALDDTAKQAGITSREMAKLQAAASIKGIGSDEFTKGVAQFSQNVYLARNNMGGLADVMRANGVGAVKDFSDAMDKAANLIQRAGSDQQRLVLLAQMGLPPTMEWVRLLSQGAAGLAKLKSEAVEFGGAINDEMVAKARQFDQVWHTFTTNFSLRWRSAGLEVLNFLQTFSDQATALLMKIPGIGPNIPRNLLLDAMRNGAGRMTQSQADSFYDVTGADRPSTRLTVTRPTVDPEVLKHQLSLEQQRIGVLGQMANVEQQVRSVEIGIQAARLNGVRVTKDEETALLALARAQAVGITQIRAQTDSARIEAATLNMSAADAAAYRAVWEKVYEARRAGRPLNEQQIRDLQAEAEELRKVMDAADRARQLKTLFEGVTTSIVDGFMDGKNAIDAANQALNNLGRTAANAAIKNALEGNFTMAAIDVVVAVAAKLGAGFLDRSQEKALEEAKKRWADMSDQVRNFNAAAEGFDLSQFVSAIQQIVKTGMDLVKAAMAAGDTAAAVQLIFSGVKQINNQVDQFINPRGNTAGEQIAAAQNEAQQIIGELNDLNAKFNLGLNRTTEILGAAAAQVAEIQAGVTKALQADINTATGKSWINDLQTLVDETKTLQSQAVVTNTDPSLIGRRFEVMAQKIVDGAQLTGDAFSELQTLFPDLTGKVHAYTAAVEDNAEALKKAANDTANNIVTFLNDLMGGPQSTLSPTAVLSNAQAAYNANYALALGGNLEAQNKFVSLADNLEKAARAVYASGQGYQDIRNQIINQGLALPAVQETTDPVVASLRDVLAAIQANGATQALDATLQNVIKAAIDAGNATAIAALLVPKFDILTETTGGVLNFSQFVQGLTGNTLSTIDEVARTRLQSIFSELDGNGNGILEKSEAIRAATYGTEGHTAGTETHTNQTQDAIGENVRTIQGSNAILSAIQGLQGTATSQLQLLNQQLAGSQNLVVGLPSTAGSGGSYPGAGNLNVNNTMLLALNKIVYNTGQTAESLFLLVNRTTTGGGANHGAFAAGGMAPPFSSFIFGEHHPQGPFFGRAGASPVAITPSMPSFANDNSALIAEVRALRAEVTRLQQIVSGSDAMTRQVIAEKGDKVADSVDEQTSTLAAQERQSNRQRKIAA